MKLYRLIVPSVAGLLMAAGTLAAYAGAQPAPAGPLPPPLVAQETDLLPASVAEDIHADATGKLWITEAESGTVRQLDPASGAYTIYTGLSNPSDGQLGPDGKLWYSLDDFQLIGRMDLASRVVTTWTMPTASANRLAFDANGRAWSLDENANVDRFDPNTHQMCTIPLPGTNPGAGGYLAAHAGAVWVGDIANGGLGRITATLAISPSYTFWPLTDGSNAPFPHGLAVGPQGEVWWADTSLGKVGRLQPGTNHVTLFGPPGVSGAEQVAYHAGKVWFSDPFTGTLGVIDPATAVGSASYTVTPTTGTLSPVCVDAGAGFTFTAGISHGVAVFTTVLFTTTVNAAGSLYAPPTTGLGGGPFGLSFVGFDLWSTDTFRDKLVRIDTAAAHAYLPVVRR